MASRGQARVLPRNARCGCAGPSSASRGASSAVQSLPAAPCPAGARQRPDTTEGPLGRVPEAQGLPGRGKASEEGPGEGQGFQEERGSGAPRRRVGGSRRREGRVRAPSRVHSGPASPAHLRGKLFVKFRESSVSGRVSPPSAAGRRNVPGAPRAPPRRRGRPGRTRPRAALASASGRLPLRPARQQVAAPARRAPPPPSQPRPRHSPQYPN